MPSPLPLLVLLLCAPLACPADGRASETLTPVEQTRLYKVKTAPATPATANAPAEAWTLRILPNPRRPSGPGFTFVRVLMLRKGKASLDGLLLTLSARDAKGKSVSRQEASLTWAQGQTSNEAFFKIESPECVPVTVVAALFGDLKPLARCETKLSFKCAH